MGWLLRNIGERLWGNITLREGSCIGKGVDCAEGIRKAEIGLCKFVGSYCIALVELDSVN